MTTDRRTFLRAATAGAILLPLSRHASAIDPIKRNGTPKFKFSLAAYSYRKLLTGKEPELTLFDFIDDCAEMQLEGTELTSYYFEQPTTPEYLRSLRQHAFRLGLDISGTAVRNDFADPEKHSQEIAQLKQWIEHAATLGAPVIRVFAGKVKKGSSEAEAHKLIVSALEECCEYSGKHGVHLALENHGGPTATVEGLLSLVKDVQSPWFGVNLDTGNFRDTDDVYGDLAKAAPYATNVQVKVTVTGPDKKEQPTDFKKLADILRDVNYRGYVVLEYEESEDPRKACPSFIEQLRSAFA